jgi:hypothetical protein
MTPFVIMLESEFNGMIGKEIPAEIHQNYS